MTPAATVVVGSRCVYAFRSLCLAEANTLLPLFGGFLASQRYLPRGPWRAYQRRPPRDI